jgi:uncharacterized protein YjbJ (UPF0337 family)
MGELIDKAKGKAKQVHGRVTGDRAREAEGKAEELKGEAKGAFEELKTDAKRALRTDDDEDEVRRAAEEDEDADVRH